MWISLCACVRTLYTHVRRRRRIGELVQNDACDG
jgi:hypothetical protein